MAVAVRALQGADDEELASRARDGDHLAFGELYRRYEPLFVAYVGPRLGEGTADAVQQVFLGILRGLPGYRGPRFFSWAYRICANATADELRRRRRRPRGVPLEDGGEPQAQALGPSPEEVLVAKRLGERLGGALESLPEGQRTVFLLARVEGLGYEAISDLLGIPVGTVKSRMFGAVRALFAEGAEP